MPRIEPFLIAALLVAGAPARAAEATPYREAFDVCRYPVRSDRVERLEQAGWKPIELPTASDALVRYLSLANAHAAEELKDAEASSRRIVDAFQAEDGDLFFARDGQTDFLWLRYQGQRLDACTLLGSTAVRTDVLLNEIRSCDEWIPLSTAALQLERWQCTKPVIFYTELPDKKLNPSVIRVPDGYGAEPKTFVLQVRT